jgi:hypothetical protein
MAVKRIQMRPPDNNYADVLHPETDSLMVLMAGSGNPLEDDFLDEQAARVNHASDLTAHDSLLSIYKSVKDANGIYTIVDYKRADGTLYMKSTLSGGTAPQYTTRTEVYYDAAGTTPVLTKTYTVSYDTDGAVVSEVLA